jgi:anti-sigma B factor antagonist
MAESKLTIEERHAGDVTVLVLTGQMLLDDEDLAFGKRISDLIDRGCAKIVVDLGGVTYIDSSGVGMIVFQLKTLKQNGGDMKLLHLDQRAESLVGMLKLSSSCSRDLRMRPRGCAASPGRRTGIVGQVRQVRLGGASLETTSQSRPIAGVRASSSSPTGLARFPIDSQRRAAAARMTATQTSMTTVREVLT